MRPARMGETTPPPAPLRKRLGWLLLIWALGVTALGLVALPVEFTKDQVSFPWFTSMPEPEVAEATTQLLTAMIKAASAAKRVSPKPPAGGNEKYAMRCFLLRLGFIGNQYKTARKVLMGNLEGNAAWANPPAPQAPQAAQVAGVTV